MKRPIIFLIIICLAKTIFAQDATNIYRNTVNSTVTIETDIGLGSGFFISENIIVTNYHVIEGASEAYCYTNNSSSKYKIEGYLAVDKLVDLILLKVSGLNRTALRIASGSPTPGQKIFVIGSP
jgi:S1-C subfamily serine protease